MGPALLFGKQVDVLAKVAFCQMHVLCHLSHVFGSIDPTTLIQTFVTLCLDYYTIIHSVLAFPYRNSETAAESGAAAQLLSGTNQYLACFKTAIIADNFFALSSVEGSGYFITIHGLGSHISRTSIPIFPSVSTTFGCQLLLLHFRWFICHCLKLKFFPSYLPYCGISFLIK